MVTKKYIKLLESNIAALSAEVLALKRRVNKLEEDSEDKDLLRSRVAYALQDVLDKNTAIRIVYKLNDQEITAQIIRNKTKELKEKQQQLEYALNAANEALEKIGEEQEK
jgi:uncharacterized protein YoxC